MGIVEKTVFISYRRTNLPWALAIYQNLTHHGYDVFFDYESVASGDFEQTILGNIRARAHFVVVLTPSALERCADPGDWLRREIETALDEKRNIVPIFLEGFDFDSPSIAKHLTGKLGNLKRYNGQNVPAGFFDEAMSRVRERFLNIALDTVLHPVSHTVQKAVQKQQVAASRAAGVEEKELTAQEWFERGYKSVDPDEKIRCYTAAIRLKPDYAAAYYNRGWARDEKGDFDGAMQDYTEAIRLKPDYADAYNNRGIARKAKGDVDGAIQDYTEAIRLRPDDADPYNNRGIARKVKGDVDGAIRDYNEAIRLKPDDAKAYSNRGAAHKAKGDPDGAIQDYTTAIRLKPDYANAHYNRAIAWKQKENYYAAIADYQKYLDLGGGIRDGDQEEVEGFIRDLKKKIR